MLSRFSFNSRIKDIQDIYSGYSRSVINGLMTSGCDVFCVPDLSSLALEEETDSVHDSTDTLPEEDRLEETSERDALLGSSGTPEVEDSFL